MISDDSRLLPGIGLPGNPADFKRRPLGIMTTNLPSWFIENCLKTSGELANSDPALHVEKAKGHGYAQRIYTSQENVEKYEIDLDFYAYARDEVAASNSHKALFFRAPVWQDNLNDGGGFLANVVHSIAKDVEADLVTLDMADMANLAEHFAKQGKVQDWVQEDCIWPDILLEPYDADFYDELALGIDPLDSISIPFEEIITAASYKSLTRLEFSSNHVILHIPNAISFANGLLGRNVLRYIARSIRRRIIDSTVTIILTDSDNPPELPNIGGSSQTNYISPEEVVGLTELGDLSDVSYVLPNTSSCSKSRMNRDLRNQQHRYYVDKLQKITRRLREAQRGNDNEEESSMLLPYSRLGAVLHTEFGKSLIGEPSFYLAQCLAGVEDSSDYKEIRNAIREARQICDIMEFQNWEDSDESENEWQEMQQNSKRETSREAIIKKAGLLDKWEMQVTDLIVDVANLKDTWKDIHIDVESRKSIVQMINLCQSNGSGRRGILRNASCKGAVLYGPPGTGKTHLARVLAKESKSVMIHLSAANILSKWVGESEKFIKAVFSVGRKVAPSIIFIDEADALLRSRSAEDARWTRSMISQFLQESDGLQRIKNPPFLLLATNNPQDLDVAVLRRVPGRLYIGMPPRRSREHIFKIFLRDETLSPMLDFKKLARMTTGYTGSDIHTLCVNAAIICEDQILMSLVNGGRASKRVLMLCHFFEAFRRSGPTVHANMLHKFRRFAHEFHPAVESRIVDEEQIDDELDLPDTDDITQNTTSDPTEAYDSDNRFASQSGVDNIPSPVSSIHPFGDDGQQKTPHMIKQMKEKLFQWGKDSTYLDLLSQRSDWDTYGLLGMTHSSRDGYSAGDIDVAHLDESIRRSKKILEVSPADPDELSTLAGLHYQRYNKLSTIVDLEESLRISRAVADTIPRESPHWARHWSRHATSLLLKYGRLRIRADLDESIEISRRVVEHVKEGNEKPQLLYSLPLAHGLQARSVLNPRSTDLDESIQLLRDCLKIALEEEEELRLTALHALCHGLYMRWRRLGRDADLDESIKTLTALLKTSSMHDGLRAIITFNLGYQFSLKFMLIQDILDLKAAISYLEAVEHLGNAPIIIMFRAKRRLLVMYLWTGNRQRIAKAAADAVTLVSKLSPRWHELADKQHMLQTEIAMVGVEAASTALEAGWSPYTALSSFEESRCVHAMSLEDLRADVRDLRQKNPRLAEQYVLLCDQLDAPASSTMTTTPPSKTSHNTQRHKSWEDLDNILNQIRQEPGFEEFLLPPSEPKIRAAAKQGPIVVIVVSEMNCDAILVEPQRIRSIRLHDLRLDDINVRGRGESLGCPGVLEWLWDAVAKPILDALGYIGPPRDSNTWPHIWWVPSGPLSKFPLHAAGYHMRNSNDTVLDRVISSYSPSVKAIVQGRHSDHPRTASSTRPVKALLIALENTPGVPERLPFAGREATMLRTLCQSMSIEVIEPDRCRKSDVLAHLPKCDFFHFAGHGHTDPNPSQSHLMVEDWAKDKLTVASLLDLNLRARRPFLAYLSACGTGEIREDYLFDESLHLINGCQLAGFRHVIGTLWEVNDEVCVEMARLTYEGIRDGGITDESVSRALHIASRKMRQQWRQQENMGSQKKKRGKGREGSGVSVRGENCRGQTTMPPSSACDTQKLGFPRVVELVDDDDDDDYGSNKLIDDGEWTERPLWIPFVHFGV